VIAYSSKERKQGSGLRIAIGMCNGYLLIVDERFTPVGKFQHSKSGQGISAMKFSNDSNWLAVASHDGRVSVYDSDKEFKKVYELKK
jgi:WD40 repeat protein